MSSSATNKRLEQLMAMRAGKDAKGNRSPTQYDYLMKLLMIGDSGVQKSQLLLRFTATAIGVDFKIKTIEIDGKNVKLQIFNCAGQENFRTITTAHYRGAKGIMLVYDVSDEQSFLNIRHWIRNIELPASDDVQKILVGHMVDSDDGSYHEHNRMITYERGEELADDYGMPFIEARAMTGENVKEAFTCLAEHIYKQLNNSDYSIQTVINRIDCKPYRKRSGHHRMNTAEAISAAVHASLDVVDDVSVQPLDDSQQQKLTAFMDAVHAEHDISVSYLRIANWDTQQAIVAYLNANNKKQEVDAKEEKKMEPLKGNESLSGPVRQLKKFLIDVGLEDYFDAFRNNDCDISYIEDFDDDTLENNIGMKSKLKRRKFLREADIFKKEMGAFHEIMIEHNVSPLVSKQLKKHGILTVHILCNEVKCKMDLKSALEINNDLQCDVLWNIVQSQINPLGVHDNSDGDYPEEGVQNVDDVDTAYI
eukprot:4425_1